MYRNFGIKLQGHLVFIVKIYPKEQGSYFSNQADICSKNISSVNSLKTTLPFVCINVPDSNYAGTLVVFFTLTFIYSKIRLLTKHFVALLSTNALILKLFT